VSTVPITMTSLHVVMSFVIGTEFAAAGWMSRTQQMSRVSTRAVHEYIAANGIKCFSFRAKYVFR
jgi:hypothetical protein